jgi:hypothetical protein
MITKQELILTVSTHVTAEHCIRILSAHGLTVKVTAHEHQTGQQDLHVTGSYGTSPIDTMVLIRELPNGWSKVITAGQHDVSQLLLDKLPID